MKCNDCKYASREEDTGSYVDCKYPVASLPYAVMRYPVMVPRDKDIHCPVFEPHPDKNQQMELPGIITTCTPEIPNPDAIRHSGAEFQYHVHEKGCVMDLYLCQDCQKTWTIPA